MRSQKDATDNRIRLFEALIYAAATIATIYLTVEEWRWRQAMIELRKTLGLDLRAAPRKPREPSPAEITALHVEARSIIEEA